MPSYLVAGWVSEQERTEEKNMSDIMLLQRCGMFACRCPNLAVKEAEDDENIEEEDVPVEKPKKPSQAKRKKQSQCKLTWIGEPVLVFILCIFDHLNVVYLSSVGKQH